MEHDNELTVRQTRARIDGDTARVEVITDQGRVMLRMHRLALGALGGAIARALWPKVGEEVPEFSVELDDVSIQPASQEPDGGTVGASDDPELHDVPIQADSQAPDEAVVGASDEAELKDVSIQPASQEPQAEPGPQPIIEDIPVEDTPAGDEARQPAEVLAAFDALWPEADESASVAPTNIPTQPELDAPASQPASVAPAEPQENPQPPHRKGARRKRRS